MYMRTCMHAYILLSTCRAFLSLPGPSWDLPGVFLVPPWDLPGVFLVPSWGASGGPPGAFPGPSLGPGAFLGPSHFLSVVSLGLSGGFEGPSQGLSGAS